MKEYTFKILGVPIAQARTGSHRLPDGRVIRYDPAKSREWKNYIKMQITASKERPEKPLDGAIKMRIDFYFLKPKSKSKKVISNKWKPDAQIKSKLGLYADLVETTAPWSTNERAKKIKLEWDNTMTAKLTKRLHIRVSLNFDNIDITEGLTHYEWEERMDLVFNFKVF